VISKDKTELKANRLVSLVIPLFNEEENVDALYEELERVLTPTGLNLEYVFIDDGSKDETFNRLSQAVKNDPKVIIVRFRRNFGQTAAMAAGFDYANGDVVVTLDGDLQNDPAEIPRMLEKLDEGYDMVAGWRKKRQDNLMYRTIPSRLGNWVISKITNVQLHDYGCTLKVMTKDVAKNIQLYGEMHRFIPAVAAELGVRIAELPVNHRARVFGRSKYGLSKAFRVVLDLLTVKFFLGYATRPLHMFGMLGLISGGLGGGLFTKLLIERFLLHMPLGGRPALIVSVMFVLIGLQFLCFGLLAEILVRTYHESQNKKTYSVRQVATFGGKKIDGDFTRRIAKIG
jgi:glycosyltransferase involved in cell wall biosynthesis